MWNVICVVIARKKIAKEYTQKEMRGDLNGSQKEIKQTQKTTIKQEIREKYIWHVEKQIAK